MPDSVLNNVLFCPFSSRKLRLLSETELASVNSKINKGELFFYPGVKVEDELTSALVTEHQSYIYPIFDNVIFLKRETAIVARNRTENAHKRVSDVVVEAFNNEYLRTNDSPLSACESEFEGALSLEDLPVLKGRLSKKGGLLLTGCSSSVDHILNLNFGIDYKQHVHFDDSIQRLRSVSSELTEQTLLVLCDKTHLPFDQDSIDSVFTFGFVNDLSKEDQKLMYSELKRVLSAEGQSISFYNAQKPLHVTSILKSDLIAKKTLKVVTPWKKIKMPKIYLHPLYLSETRQNDQKTTAKTSFRRQFS